MTRCDCARPPGCAAAIRPVRACRPQCARPLLPALALCLAFGLWPGTPTQAQPGPPVGHRVFPAHALRAELVVGAAPMVLLNGLPARLAPGARLRGADNLLRLPAQMVGQPTMVHYTLEPGSGLLMEVWILNSVERANEPWPTSAAQATGWRFDPTTQRWTR